MARAPKLKKQVEALAVITDDDVELAKQAWRRDAPGPMKRLLDAVPVNQGKSEETR